MRVAMTAFDGTLILLTSSRDTLPLQTRPAPTTTPLVTGVSVAQVYNNIPVLLLKCSRWLPQRHQQQQIRQISRLSSSRPLRRRLLPRHLPPPPRSQIQQPRHSLVHFQLHFAFILLLLVVRHTSPLTPTLTGYELAVALSATALSIVLRHS